jgi:hypothetical protein
MGRCDACSRSEVNLCSVSVAQNPEHQYLSQCVLDVLDDFTATALYGYREAERARFDFACELVRDWERALIGQTLWSHSRGIDKDLRTLIANEDAAIRVYVARDDVLHRRALHEAVHDYRATDLAERIGQLRVFWILSDFDADQESHRELARDSLREQVLSDLLSNVVFERLTRHDVHALANTTGRIGLLVGLLNLIAKSDGKLNYAGMAAHLGVSPNSVRERFSLLRGLGLVDTPPRGLAPQVSPKGKVMIDLLAAIDDAFSANHMTHELNAVLVRLECSPFVDAPVTPPQLTQRAVFEQLWHSYLAARDFGVRPELDRIFVPDDPIEVDAEAYLGSNVLRLG